MKTSKILCTFVAVAILFTSLFTVTATAETYDRSGYFHLSKPSKAEIVKLLKDTSSSNVNNLYETNPSLSAPYALGKINRKAQEEALARVNAFRRMAGVPIVSLVDEYMEPAQGAVLINAVNNTATTTLAEPKRPEGMSDDLYEICKDGSRWSNVTYTKGTDTQPLLTSVDMWINHNPTCEKQELIERRRLLDRGLIGLGFGCANKSIGLAFVAAYSKFDYTDHGNFNFVSWPASGYMPNDTSFFTTKTPWHITLNKELYDLSSPSLNAITVTLTNSEGKKWIFTSSSSDNRLFNSFNSFDADSNALIFTPDNIEKYEGVYTVEVSNIKKYEDFKLKTITLKYQVEFFSSEDVDLNEKPETPAEGSCPDCGSQLSNWSVTTPAMCNTDGLESRNCKTCQYEERRVIPKTLTCAYKWVVTKEATPTEAGEKALQCTMCGHIKEKQQISPIFVLGDITGDNLIQATDARKILRYVAGLDILTEAQLKAADVNKDGYVTAVDARIILRVVAGLDTLA